MNHKEKLFSREWFQSYGLVTLGCFLLAIGFNFFISPHKIVPGGVYGIGIIVNSLTEGLFPRMGMPNGGFPIGTAGFLLDIPITITGIIILGAFFGAKTVYGITICMIFMDYIGIPVKAIAPNDILLSAVFGGVVIGAGVGLIFRGKGASGGTDTIAMMFHKYTKLPLGMLVMMIDTCIVLLGLIFFKDWTIPLYSFVTIFVTGKVIDLVVEGFVRRKAVFIVSENYEAISKIILCDLGRGGTYLKGSGMYTDQDKRVIFTAVNRKQLITLKEEIHRIDPNAFVTIMETSEILGDGFKEHGQ